jgi:hypothetical protein
MYLTTSEAEAEAEEAKVIPDKNSDTPLANGHGRYNITATPERTDTYVRCRATVT